MQGKEPSYQKVPQDADERWSEKTELAPGRRGRRNDYADNFYTSDIPAFKINPTVDKIKLSSVPARYLSNISQLLTENGFKKISDTTPKGKYGKNRMFQKGSTGVKIFYNLPASDLGGRPIFIEINEPTQDIIKLLNQFFTKFSIFPKISQLEIAFDFITDNPVRLRDALDKHLFLRYQRHRSFSFKTTFYSSDCRKTSKGTRTYPKKINGQKVIRLELVLNRRVIKQLRLELSWLPISKIDFTKYFSFKVLAFDKITAYLVRVNKEEIENLNKLDGMSGELLIRVIESWMGTNFVPDIPWDEKLMKHVETLKTKKRRIINYSRFLKDHIVLNQKFREALVDKAFFPTQEKE